MTRLFPVVAVLALGAVLRYWGLDHGLPHLRARPDELEVIESTAGFVAGDFNPRFFVYPNFYSYVAWAWELGALAVTGIVDPIVTYGRLVRDDVPSLIWYGRTFSAAIGTGTIAVAYAMTHRMRGPLTAGIAALLLATNFLHVRDSHALKPDVCLGLALLIALWTIGRLAEHRTHARAIAAGVTIGLAMSFKYNAIMLMLPVYLVAVQEPTHSGVRRLLGDGRFWTTAAAGATTFLVLNPYLWLDYERMLFIARFLALTVFSDRPGTRLAQDASLLDTATHFVRTRAFGYHVTTSLRYGAGLAATVLAVPALVLAFRRSSPAFLRMGACFMIGFYLLIGAAPVHLARYCTALMPFLAIAIAHLLVTATRRIAPPTVAPILALGLAIAVVAEPLAASIAHDRIATQRDTRVLAYDWMANNLPPRSVVAVLGGGIFPYADPEVPAAVGVQLARDVPASAFGAHGVTHVVTHEHPLRFSRLDPATHEVLEGHLAPLVDFTPFRDAPRGGFEEEDAFYIPFFDFDGVVRPGPRVRVWSYRP